MRVVIVEDEIRIREGITKLLNRFYDGITEIYEAKSGEEGLDIIRRHEPDLVITDIRMEPVDGLEMLEILLKREKRSFKTIILSAHSEFDYAKQGIKLGISEYLVKPVDVGEFRLAMQHVEDDIAKEKIGKLNSFEAVLSGILSGRLAYDAELESFVEKTYGINSELAFLCVYLGKRFKEESQLAASVVSASFVRGGYRDYHMLFLPQEQELLFVVSGGYKNLERYLQYNLIREINGSLSAVFGFTACEGLNNAAVCVANIRRYLPWNISLGNDVLISYPKVTQIQTSAFVYPVDIEKESIDALCRADYKLLNTKAEEMLGYLTKQIFSPDTIIKGVVRYLLAILGVVREVNFSAYEKLDEREILESVTKAVTLKELEFVIFRLLEEVMRRDGKTVGLLVRKAQRMIEEFYSQGITLEEVSASLNITPEHISAQFVKEMGVNFSTYIKNFRLNKAKELLIGTDLKLYEIAQLVGYNDAKYFSRVFKENEGVLPANYRKNHK